MHAICTDFELRWNHVSICRILGGTASRGQSELVSSGPHRGEIRRDEDSRIPCEDKDTTFERNRSR
jgi:hypothetical protein